MSSIDRVALGRDDLLAAAAGLALTALAIASAQHEGAQKTLELMLGGATFVAVVVGFVRIPHVLVALTIGYFTILPALKVFVTPRLGATKDVVSLAAAAAAGVLYIERRRAPNARPIELRLIVPIGFLLAFYVVNLGGALSGETGHGIAWFHGVRLFAEPLVLFVVAAMLRNPRRTLQWGVTALVAACLVNALYGLVQQAMGLQRLLAAGYTYGEQVRQISGHLRSFGTLDEPFAYAGFLLLGLAALLLWSRWRRSTWLIFVVLAAGIAVSYVRTAAVVIVSLFALALARRGRGRYAVLLMLIAVVAAVTAFAIASQKTATRSVRLNSTTYLTLNGRANIWRATLRSPSNWIFGRGVGATGTASQRATESLLGGSQRPRGGTVADSSYFVLIADVGLAGLAVLLGFFAGLLRSAAAAARAGERAAWLGAGLGVVTLLDAVTRESFTAFPTAYCAMLLMGLAYAVWQHGRAERSSAAPLR